MIDIRKLKELVRLMVDNELTEVDLRDNEEQVTLRRDGKLGSPTVSYQQPMMMPMQHHAAPAAHSAGATAPAASAEAPAAAESTAGLITIESPMVGTFFSAANPDSPPFVSVGTRVDADTVVCLVEAMKIFNEIKAEHNGTIHKVLVSNGEAVEFGQALFLIKPD